MARWRRGTLSVREFCENEGLSVPTFYWWRRKLQQPDEQKLVFHPVHVVEEIREPVTRGIEVVLANGRCLRVEPGFDSSTLVKLVELLESRRPTC